MAAIKGIEWVATGMSGPAAGLEGATLRSWVVETIPPHGECVNFPRSQNADAFRAAKVPAKIDRVLVRTDTRPDLAKMAAELLAAAEACRAEVERKCAEESAAGKAECPEGFVPCRRKWANGDLCSAEYEAEDGTKVIASDLIADHAGWFFLPSADVDAARAKAAEAAAAKAARGAATVAKEASAILEARATGREVVVATWCEDCAGGAVECSTDSVARVALPDGKIVTRRNHTY